VKLGALKNIFAAVGVVVVSVLVLSFIIALLAGGGVGGGDKVAVVKIEGLITDATEVTRELEEYADRDDVKAVVVRIETPGGAVAPSQELHSGIKRLAKKKTVVASLGAVAASGGYYAAVAADRIVANPGTITGSIGVIIEFVNASELLSKVGLKGHVVKSGQFKDTGSPIRDMTTEERALIQALIDDVNSQFITAVAEGRGLDLKVVTPLADGRIFSGSQAAEVGLVDTLGDLTDAVELAAKLAGMEEEPPVIYPKRRDYGFWEMAFEGAARIAGITGGGYGVATNRLFGLFSGYRVMYLAPLPGA
jgi:protease-4